MTPIFRKTSVLNFGVQNCLSFERDLHLTEVFKKFSVAGELVSERFLRLFRRSSPFNPAHLWEIPENVS
jgi:hypothetical protein